MRCFPALHSTEDRQMLGRILLLALPLILSNLTQPLLSTTDTFLSGHLPTPAALGGVAISGIFFNAIFWSFGFLRMATTGLVSQSFGAQRHHEAATHTARALLLALMLGVLILIFSEPLLTLAFKLISGSEAARTQALIYCRIRIFSAPAALVNYVVLGTLLGRQRARIALLIQAAIQIINAALALFLVLGLHWAIAGIATATLTAEYCGSLMGIAILLPLLKGHRLHLRQLLNPQELRKLFALNRDILIRTLALVAAYGWFTRSGATASDVTLAANALLLNLISIASYGLDGFANATEALVGESVGAQNRQRLLSVLRTSTLCALLTALLFSTTFLLTGWHLVPLFTNQPAVITAARQYLPWLALMPLISVWGFQLDGIFIGATRAHDLRNSMLLSFLFFLAISSLLVPRFANHGLWLAFTLFMAVRGVTLALRLPALLRSVSQ